jgi:hypothetical protein
MANYFNETSKSADFPLVTDEIEYTDPLIPKKLQTYFLPNTLLEKYVVQSWTGDVNEVYDNAAELYDSMNYEEDPENLGKPEVAINFKFERVERNPTVMHHRLYFGKGEAVLKNGMKYNGDMQFSLFHGRGTLEGPGFKYSGTFRNSEIEGEGTYEWEKCVYEGEVKRGLRNGYGSLKFDNGIEYTGYWREGLREGYGTLKYPSGQTYEGYWEKGKKHGHGVLKYASGNYYEGLFQADKQNGQGTIYWITSNEKYTGEWKDGLPHGYGVHIWLDNKGNKQLRNRYVGNWAFGKRNGHGEFYYANGSKYKGEWVNDLKEGMGTMIFEDGSVYSGPFEKDRMVNRTLSGQLEVPNTSQVPPPTKKPPGKAGSKPKELPKNKESSNPVITTQRAKRNVEANPYKNLIDVTDLLYNEDDPSRAEKEVAKILLQFNSGLKEWYEIYSSQVEAKEREESFTMTSKQMWRFFKDCKVISYKVSIANLNRLFLRGAKNLFKITSNAAENISTNDQSSLSRISSVQQPVPNLDISNIPSNPQDSMSEEEALNDMNTEDVHSTDRPILFRQFAESVVRASYLKYSNGGKLLMDNVEQGQGDDKYIVEKPKSQLGISLLKLFSERLLPYGGKSTCKSIEEEAELEEGINSLEFPTIQKIFLQYSRKDRGQKERRDVTIQVSGVLSLLQDSGLTPYLITFAKVLEIIEKYHDTDTSYTCIALSQKSDKVKNRVLAKVLGLELTEYEFYECLVLIALEIMPKEGRKEEVELSVVRSTVEKFLNDKLVTGLSKPGSQRFKGLTSSVSKVRVFPKSQKQLILDAYNKEKAEQIRKELEESLIMEAEDSNINLIS